MEQETRRELASLQRERELLQAKEKDNLDAIDEVHLRWRVGSPSLIQQFRSLGFAGYFPDGEVFR